ncbi:hypothetical protein [Streptomyces sp. NPDC058279]|uniref:hypothetical protein n=1 Tax=Streptomyces sp. NPDC058279 TaxID=3346418 RepID=UPI0036E42F4D
MEQPGHVLIVAADPSPAWRRRWPVVEATAGLAAVSPAVLTTAPTAHVVQVAAPTDPHVLLAHLRTAAMAPGPLLVYLGGLLALDDRQGRPHMAISHSTSRTLRYSGLPWDWLRAELAVRPPDVETVVVADLVAGTPAAWAAFDVDPDFLTGPYALYGTVQAPTASRAAPAYTHALTAALRAAQHAPPHAELHAYVTATADLPPATTHWLTAPAAVPGEPPPAPEPEAEPDEQEPGAVDYSQAVAEAWADGRHTEAYAIVAALEAEALREHGPSSPQAAHWTGIRADLAYRAGRYADACHLWLQRAGTLLGAGVPHTDPAVRTAVDNAHHCWHHVEPAYRTRLGSALLSVRRIVPGPPGAQQDVQQRLILTTT